MPGATFYGAGSYHLTQMIDRLNGGAGLGPKVNCTDSATTVATFANLVGCDLWQSRMASSFASEPDDRHRLQQLGHPVHGQLRLPRSGLERCLHGKHRVFDGCLKIDADADPDAPHTAVAADEHGLSATARHELPAAAMPADGDGVRHLRAAAGDHAAAPPDRLAADHRFDLELAIHERGIRHFRMGRRNDPRAA